MKLLNNFFNKIVVTLMLLIAVNFAAYAQKSNVLSKVTGDWNQDKKLDAAVLMKHDGLVELYIFLGSSQSQLQQALYKKEIAWMGTMEGATPYLESRKGSLLILSENDSIGRHRWSQVLTVAYRNKIFVMGGYTYESRDTLNPSSIFYCDVNLFTGNGFKNKVAFKTDAQKIALKDWSDERIPKECVIN
jgi:hypothetical protein